MITIFDASLNLKLKYPIWIKLVIGVMLVGSLGGLYYSIFLNNGDYIFPIIGLTLLILAGFIDTFVSTTWINADEVFYDSFLQKKRLKLTDIDHYEVNEYGIKLYSKQGKPKNLTISNYLIGYGIAMQWAKTNFDAATEDSYENELVEAANNESLGDTITERVAYVEKVKKQLKWLKIITVITPILHLTVKPFNQLTYPILLVLPLSYIAITVYHKEVIKLYDTKKHLDYFYPNALTGLAISSMVIALMALLKFDLYDIENAWVTISLVMIVLVYTIWKFAPKSLESKPWHKLGTLLILLLFFGFYSFGLIIGINCTYDTSETRVYKTTMQSKQITSGKTKSHDIKLDAWGPLNKTTTSGNLKAKLYNSINVGDTLKVNYHSGLLGVPWFEIKQ